MKPVRVLIVDDEADAVAGLRTMLRDFCTGVEVVGESSSAIEGVKLIRRLQPDAVFLDVEMPGGDGFSLIDSLDKANRPAIIFTTAHREYAISALREQAFDYLLKPVDIDELQNAVEKAKNFLASRNSRELQPGEEQRMRVSTPEGIVFIPLSEIIHIEASGRYSIVHSVHAGSHTVTRNIGEYEEELTGSGFFRVHKSHLVNCRHALRISSADGGFLELSNGRSIEISRRKKSEFMLRMKG
ncbi:MAG TPA: LytTR family DNA-binding domain-containing protein [Bacteroidia bacterium]|nr:LytTR family DNA-binding domain-containing protein [Bacteroidia bacterium]